MVLIGLSCTSLWLLYGIRVGNVFMWGPNGLAFALGMVQLYLLIKYRTGPKTAPLPI